MHGSSSRATNVASQTITRLGALLIVCLLSGILLAALFLPAVTVASAVADQGVETLEEFPSELDVQPPNEASRIEAADGSLLAVFYSENRIVVPMEDISPYMRKAVVAIEDRRFYEHSGVDPKGIARALISNSSGGSTQGGSTLTQQYVKNALLVDAVQRGDDDAKKDAVRASYARKLREAKLALSLESKLTEKHGGDQKAAKDEILTGYLNIAQFGPSQYGVETASRHFFSKHAKDLTPAEAALLAGLVNGPNLYDPVKHPERAMKRRNEVLSDMRSVGYLSDAEYKQAKDTPLEAMLKIQNTRAGCQDAGGAGFFCDYVTRSLLHDPKFAPTAAERKRLLYGGGLTIKTTLDSNKEKLALEILERRVPATSESGFGHSIVTVEPGTGKILVMAQNRKFNARSNVQPGETALNYTAPKALGGGNGFEVGSTFKPFVLAEWLKAGHSVWDKVETKREPMKRFPAKCLNGGAWVQTSDPYNPDNAVSVKLGPTQTVLDATKYSVNTSYARMARELDLCDIADTAISMGGYPTDFNRNAEDNRGLPVNKIFPREIAPSVMALGQVRISSLDMAAAYAAFAADGEYCKPQAITEVTDRNGKKLPFTGTECKRVMSPEVAQAIQYTLKQDLEDPHATGKGMTIPGHEAGGKTGTSSFQYHTWYVGFTKQMSTAVWFGHPNANVRPGGFQVDGQYLVPKKVWGNTVSLPTWHEFMTRASEGTPNIPFPGPPAQPAVPTQPVPAPRDGDADNRDNAKRQQPAPKRQQPKKQEQRKPVQKPAAENKPAPEKKAEPKAEPKPQENQPAEKPKEGNNP
ncbi:transglycosylase domain-containing protein [Dermabacteraceae bacterium TAE3-ERU5]|nr:transglycosylase domain-containing protein [Dermabacteraceae bacterium TAE3-ERU5]